MAHAPLTDGNFARFLCDFSVIRTFVRTDSHFLRPPRPDKTATPVPPMACEGESANVPKTSTASHCLPAAAKGDATLPRYIHPQRSLFLYLSLESFLKTIRHHRCPPSYVKFTEKNTVVKNARYPVILPNTSVQDSQTSMDNSYHFKVNL